MNQYPDMEHQESTGNASHFNNKHLSKVERALGITDRFGAVYHPASQAIVSKPNPEKKKMPKYVCHYTTMTQVDALPLALMFLGFTPHK